MRSLDILVILSILMQQGSGQNSDKVLSRRKRYLIFPEGSSLQLVYCLTMPVIGKSTIFTIGGTAALAWELPHDPFQPYRKPAELLHRLDPPGKYLIKDPLRNISDIPAVQLEPGVLIATPPPPLFIRPPLSYPISMMTLNQHHQPLHFPSMQYSPTYNRYRYYDYRRHQMPKLDVADHRKQFQPHFRFAQQDSVNVDAGLHSPTNSQPSSLSIYHQVHRRTRRNLYAKIEKFLSAQSKDGRACLLKAICQMHQRNSEKGSFMEEIMRSLFRAKLFDRFHDEDAYDSASNRRHNCTEMYSSCQSSILHFI